MEAALIFYITGVSGLRRKKLKFLHGNLVRRLELALHHQLKKPGCDCWPEIGV